MEGEPKKEMYDLLPKNLYPTTFNVIPGQDFTDIRNLLIQHKIEYPLIVKPEVAGQGILLRKIDNEEQLEKYHQKVPVEYIIQQMISYPMEVSAFYYRFPDQPKGVITGFLYKIPLHVTGDGQHTLRELIMQHPKAIKREGELASKHGNNFSKVLAPGEKYMLSYAANHNRGAHFINLNHEVDEKLVQIFDSISLSINDFFYGRYDILCNSLEDLKNGKNFSILEYNGCGAEPNHFYDTGFTLRNAYREILRNWNVLFKISKYNHRRGIKYWPLLKGIQFLRATKKHYRIIREADQLIH
jgi:D-alanine-D-alanine ligase-like ATP-grasp enzyme